MGPSAAMLRCGTHHRWHRDRHLQSACKEYTTGTLICTSETQALYEKAQAFIDVLDACTDADKVELEAWGEMNHDGILPRGNEVRVMVENACKRTAKRLNLSWEYD